MIHYTMDSMGVLFVFRRTGSLIPKALLMALPSGVLGFTLHLLRNHISAPDEDEDEHQAGSQAEHFASVLAGYSFVLGAMLTFRTSIAYSRWWEAGTLMQQLRGQWLNAYSNVLAFCSSANSKKEDVEHFQQSLVRLMSLIHCAAFEQVSENLSGFEVLDMQSMDPESLEFLKSCSEPCEIVLQWIQRLIVENINLGVVDIAPPIVSRVFQELSLGIQAFQNARKMKNFPFPYPYAQILTVLLLAQVVVMPVICGFLLASALTAGISSLLVVFAFWAINYIAMELEFPYGSDANDLPLHDMQREINRILSTLLHQKAQCSPVFSFESTDFVRGGAQGGWTERLGAFEVETDASWVPLSSPGAKKRSRSMERMTRSQTRVSMKAGSMSTLMATMKAGSLSTSIAMMKEGWFGSKTRTSERRMTANNDRNSEVDNRGFLDISSAQENLSADDRPQDGSPTPSKSSAALLADTVPAAHVSNGGGAHLEELLLEVGTTVHSSGAAAEEATEPRSPEGSRESSLQAQPVVQSPRYSWQQAAPLQPNGCSRPSGEAAGAAPAAAAARLEPGDASRERCAAAASLGGPSSCSHPCSSHARPPPRLAADDFGEDDVRAELAPIRGKVSG